jgi:hypothetical protein
MSTSKQLDLALEKLYARCSRHSHAPSLAL